MKRSNLHTSLCSALGVPRLRVQLIMCYKANWANFWCIRGIKPKTLTSQSQVCSSRSVRPRARARFWLKLESLGAFHLLGRQRLDTDLALQLSVARQPQLERLPSWLRLWHLTTVTKAINITALSGHTKHACLVRFSTPLHAPLLRFPAFDQKDIV